MSNKLILRDYQELSLQGLRNGFAAGHRSQMLYLPTGGGKTEVSLDMLTGCSNLGKRCAMVMDRRILVDQTSLRMDKYGIDHGVLMAGHWRYLTYKSIQVCSAQTLEKRGSFPNLNLLIIDEAHNTRAGTVEFIKNNPQVKVVGLSASPFTRGLGGIYTKVVSGSTTKNLVERGSLAPLRVFIAKEIDMSGAKKVAGEWSHSEAGAKGIQITGDIVSEWVKKSHEIFGKPEKTIVFCAGIAHGQDLSEKFKAAGYNFVSICHKDSDDVKESILREFSKPDSTIQGLIATDLLTKGFDQADVMIGISARPFSKSFSSHVQQLGRIMRPHPNKSSAIWLDHSGNFLRFQDQWEDLYHNGVQTLDDGAERTKKEPTKEEKEAAKCPKCGELWQTNGDVCQHCGHIRVRRNTVIALPGKMTEILIGGKVAAKDQKDLWLQLCTFVIENNKNHGYAFHLFKKIAKEIPSFKFNPNAHTPPTVETAGKIRSIEIAYRNSKKAMA